MLKDQAYRPLPHLRWIPSPSCHGSILSRTGASTKPGAVQWLRGIALLALCAVTATTSFTAVKAANPSTFTEGWNGCTWQGFSRKGSVGQAWTRDVYPTCLSYCHLYGQWIGPSGTYHWYTEPAKYCEHYHEWGGSPIEVYAGHQVIKGSQFSSLRSTDAY